MNAGLCGEWRNAANIGRLEAEILANPDNRRVFAKLTTRFVCAIIST